MSEQSAETPVQAVCESQVAGENMQSTADTAQVARESQVAGGMPLVVRDLRCGYKDTVVVDGLSFEIAPGEICAILGQNGIGKTTVFKSILGHIPLLGGSVLISGHDAASLSRTEMARLVGYVPQAHTPPFPFTVAEMVEMGRTAHLPLTAVPSRDDRLMALEAMNSLGIAHLYDKPYTQISGGERQLALIARALCQQARLLIMDEPCANLDFGNRARVLGQVEQLTEQGIAVLMTTHDPDHALAIATSVVAIVDRSEFVIGKPADVIDSILLERLYDIPAQVSCVPTPAGDSFVAIALKSK